MQGIVKSVVLDRGFGFIAQHGGNDVFFHYSDLTDALSFDEQLLQRYVAFEVRATPKGDRAANVRPAD